MRERVRNIMVGACTVGALGAGSALLFLFGEIEPMFARRWHLKVAFNDAGGLRRGSLVTLNGVPIGAIETVSIWNDPTQPVLVVASINDGVTIPDPSEPTVQASLLGSGARLELTAALPLRVPTRNYPMAGDTVLRGQVRSIDSRIVDQLDERLQPLIASFGEIGKLARNLNTMVEPTPDGAAPSEESLRTAVKRLNEMLASADSTLRDAKRLLGDEQFQVDLRDTVHGASEFMRDATVMTRRIGALADSLQADAATLRAGALPVLDRASVALQELEQLMVAARTGKGTLGRLMQDPQLYEGLSDAAKRLDEALGKLNLLLDKIRAEGLGVEFGSK